MAMSPLPLLQTINTNAGWCWFQGERAVVTDGQLFVGSVASGADGDSRAGNVEVTQFDLITSETHVAVLAASFQEDDHNAPALHVRHDGRLVALYSKHSSDNLARWRVSEHPVDASSWGPEQTLETADGYCYNNVFRLGSLGQPGEVLLNFHRGIDRNPNYLISNDDGLTWRYGGKLMAWQLDTTDARSTTSDGTSNSRPYVRYAQGVKDGRPDGTVHFITTEDHPRGYDNSVYHGLVKLVDSVATLCTTDGAPLAPLATSSDATVQPTDFTRLYTGSADAVAWTVDLRVGPHGHPHALFSTQRGDANVRGDRFAGGEDLRYHHARWDGTAWHETEIAHAGSALYAPEVDYPGLGVLDPANPNVAVISTNAHPITGAPLISSADGHRHYEIFRAVSPKDGGPWNWTALTQNSTTDQIRPLLAPSFPYDETSPSPMIWLRGQLTTYGKYNLEAVVLPDSSAVQSSGRRRFAGGRLSGRLRLRLTSTRRQPKRHASSPN